MKLITNGLIATMLLMQSFVAAQTLDEKLQVKDSILFEAVFHSCKMDNVESVFSIDFEYLQDKGDKQKLSVTSRAEFIGNIKKRCERGNGGMIIKRLTSAVQAFPMGETSAMQTGIQRFYLVVPGKPDQLMEESRFNRIWTIEKNEWKMQREQDNVYEIPKDQAMIMEQPLYKEIAHMDSVEFNAFNTQDFAKFKSLFSESLEFYQDNTGFTDYAWNMNNFKQHMDDPAMHTRRQLVEGSLEVYPLKGYGAIEIGVHQFYSKQGSGEKLEATAKFMTLWQKIKGEWKIARVISFDHR